MSGDIDGRRVALSVSPESSDNGPFGVEDICLSVALRRAAPEGLTLESATGMIGTVQHLLTERQIETGDADFDGNVVVTANNESDVYEWLTVPRRQAFLLAVRAAPADVIRLISNQLEWQSRSAVSDLNELGQHLERLMAVASAIDAGDGNGRNAVE